jgi:short-subunit dehydrogenase
MELKNKHIVITGASRGIGRAFAKVAAQDKAHLHLVVRKKDQDLEDEMLAAGAASCQQWLADLSDRRQVEKLIEETADIKADILFNNAGLLCGGLLEEQNMDEIQDMLQVNVNSLIQLTHAFLPRMLQRKKGKIVNHASVAALMHFPCASTYSASKAAVWAFTNCLRLELKDTGVTTLNLISPGVRTTLFDKLLETYGKNMKVPDMTVPPVQYAEMIREAILFDLETLNPRGLTGIGLKLSKYAPQIFDFGVLKKYKR